MKPIYALSVRQPWAYWLATGLKPCENRGWPNKMERVIVIHAGSTNDKVVQRDIDQVVEAGLAPRPDPDSLLFGGFIGIVLGKPSVLEMKTPWFSGPWAMPVSHAKKINFIQWRGRLNFFRVDDVPGLAEEVEDWRKENRITV